MRQLRHLSHSAATVLRQFTSQEIGWKDITQGEIYSYCIVNVAIVPAIRDCVPYVPAVVSLPEADGVRMITNIVACPIDLIEIGRKVTLVWHDRADGVAIPWFTVDAARP